jgi:methylmalonyl-CoA mutase C-terminal domain/subunit
MHGRIRVVVSKVGLDGHDRGARIIAQGFRDAGMEVIYLGLRRQADELAETMVQEDADVLGLSILSGAVVPLTARVIASMRSKGLEDRVLLVGGIVSPQLGDRLIAMGADGAFGPGTPLAEMVAFTENCVRAKRRELSVTSTSDA